MVNASRCRPKDPTHSIVTILSSVGSEHANQHAFIYYMTSVTRNLTLTAKHICGFTGSQTSQIVSFVNQMTPFWLVFGPQLELHCPS